MILVEDHEAHRNQSAAAVKIMRLSVEYDGNDAFILKRQTP